ncbi:MAG: VOC family protein [Pseudomonadota bacterium]
MSHTPSIVPYLSYADGKAAIAFLTKAFGLSVVQSYDDENGVLQHAEMRFGNGIIMMGTADMAKGSPGIYLVVEDVQAHFDAAKAAGAQIVYPPEQTEWGTWRYRAKDPEGHEWSFGSYAPSTEPPSWG